MSTQKTLCGIECEFSKKSDIWYFFSFPDIALDHYFFWAADASVFSRGKRIEIPEEFVPAYFAELNQKFFWGERLVLHLYPEDTSCGEIENYEDFLKSPCEMIILLYDFYYLEIYCKNKVWLQTLICTARNIPDSNVEEKFEQTDTRMTMYV